MEKTCQHLVFSQHSVKSVHQTNDAKIGYAAEKKDKEVIDPLQLKMDSTSKASNEVLAK